VSRKIINQNPMVKMVRNAMNPRYWSNSIMVSFIDDTKIIAFD
jgi:hypothetical protein